jgi:integrase
MAKKRLTEVMVQKLNTDALKAKGKKQLDYYDAIMPGLVLRLNYGGSKVWRAVHYLKRDGKHIPTTKTLGTYPIIKLAEARDRARTFLADPQAALAKVESGSFRDIAEKFINLHVREKKLRSEDEIARCLEKYIYPRWQHRAFEEIRRSDVTQLMDEVVNDHGASQADHCLSHVSKIANWYATRNNDYVSPVVRGMKRNGGKGKRERTLNDDEIRQVWRAASDNTTFGALVRVLLLTAQRREKVATMQWRDIVGDEWRMAKEEREKANAGDLKLPKLALDIIQAQPRIAGNPYVFAAGKGKGPFNSFSQRKEELDSKLEGVEPWTVHDLRRTARSLMSRARVDDNIAERTLGHAIPGVKGVYDRHAYFDEKGEALAKLAELVQQIISGRGKAARKRRS